MTSLVLRTSGDPLEAAPSVRAVIRSLDPRLQAYFVRSMDQVLDDTLAGRRFPAALLAVFAVAALVLAAVGIYGVLACAVAERTREIGIRRALGAPDRQVVGMVVTGALRPALAGIVAGIAGASAAARAFSSLLFGVPPTDPLALGLVALVLLAVAAAAAWIPARRAARIDPMNALRYE